MSYKLPVETIQKIREEVLGGKSKYQVALELDVSFDGVYKNTKWDSWEGGYNRGNHSKSLQGSLRKTGYRDYIVAKIKFVSIR